MTKTRLAQLGTRDWQHRGRCTVCGMKAAGPRRIRQCSCGARVNY